MKTRCPACQTTFRVTPEQLKVRAGDVRCGQCRAVFNALDGLLDDAGPATPSLPQPESMKTFSNNAFPLRGSPEDAEAGSHYIADIQREEPSFAEKMEPPAESEAEPLRGEEEEPLNETTAQELGKATGLISPRATSEIPGYSKWAEGAMFGPVSLPREDPTRWPFVLASLLLVLALVGQIVFRFRGEIAVTSPSLRPILEQISGAFDSNLPLPRHVALVSIETSDLQSDPAHGDLLVLNATLRNRANYEQAYPSLELSLTDTQDAAIARRVFSPGEYLSPKIPADQPFAANSDVAVHLWIEAKEISAAGYRLYIFYP